MFGGWWAQNAYETGGPALVVAWVFWVVISIMFHELAHGWAAIGRGDQTPVLTGHMTFNPLVHMGTQSVVMLALLGIAWGAMPIDPTRMKGRYAEAWVALAGPLTNFLIAVICILGGGVAVATMTSDQIEKFIHGPFEMLKGGTLVAPKLAVFAGVGAMLNISLGIFNLFPLPPLDGSRILANFSRSYRNFTMTDGGRIASMIAFILAFFFAGRFIVPVGMLVTVLGMGAVAMVLRLLGVGP
jgi:Zn-dependent protease